MANHQTELVAPPRVLAEVHQVRLPPVVRPLCRTLPQAPWLGCQHLPGNIAPQGRRGPRRGQAGNLEELAGIPHPGQLLQQPDCLLFRHFYLEPECCI